MSLRARPIPTGPAIETATDDESRKRAIARAVWTEIHWLMPVDRPVTIAVDGDAIAVEFGPLKPAAMPCSTDRRHP